MNPLVLFVPVIMACQTGSVDSCVMKQWSKYYETLEGCRIVSQRESAPLRKTGIKVDTMCVAISIEQPNKKF